MNLTERRKPVTIAVRLVPSIPWVTSSAVERAENPDGPFHPNIHIFLQDLGHSLRQIIPNQLNLVKQFHRTRLPKPNMEIRLRTTDVGLCKICSFLSIEWAPMRTYNDLMVYHWRDSRWMWLYECDLMINALEEGVWCVESFMYIIFISYIYI